MDCTTFLDRYSDYDDSLLTPEAAAAFRAHLEGCPSCTRYDRVLRKGRMLARQVAAAPSSDFHRRLYARILAEPRPTLAAAGPVAAGGFLTLALAALAGIWAFDSSAAFPTAHDAPERATTLPRTAHLAPADWTAGRVARRASSSYSPLVIGPPAYAAEPRSMTTGLSSATSHTLD